MSAKEKFLLQMIQNIIAEIRQRGTLETFGADIGFKLIYAKQDSLIDEYSTELEAIVSLIHELEDLESYVSRIENRKILDEISDLKSQLGGVLENRKLHKKKQHTKSDAAKLIQQYSIEIDSLLKIYDQLELFEKIASQKNDQEILATIQSQKQKLIRIIGLWQPEESSETQDDLVQEYMLEAEKVVAILNQIDQIADSSRTDTTGVRDDIQKTKADLVRSVDRRILVLLGYHLKRKVDGPSISDYLKQWKAHKYSEFTARLTQYRILKQRLVATATASERNRMLELDMSDALLNFAAKDYDLADLQFNEILKFYSDYFPNMDGIHFYICEANFARSYFDAAFAGYSALLDDYPDSNYRARAIWKMMLISFTYGWKSKLFSYYEKLKQLPPTLEEEQLSNAHYLAGYAYAEAQKFKDAKRALELISESSKYYYPGQYLLGIVYVNLDNFSKAKKIFTNLADIENYPWSDINAATIRNDALIKLGYIHYQRGEYEKALDVFNRVSKGYEEFDNSLIAQAWANLKTGKYSDSIDKTNALLNIYVSSNYTYEALALSAHCKRILDKKVEAKADLQYISSARSTLDLSEKYNEERRHIIEQSKELNRLEEEVLERQDEALYPEVQRIRDTLNEALLAFSQHGTTGSIVIRQLNDERREIVRQVQRLDAMIKQAREGGNYEELSMAEEQRERLLNILKDFENTSNAANTNHFIEYPLATKEGGIAYRRGILNNMIQDMVTEKKRLEADIAEVTKLLGQRESMNDIESSVDLEMLESELQDLQNRLNRLQIWLTQNEVEDLNTNFEHWTDYSGLGMTDINFGTIKDQQKKIEAYSQNVAIVEDILSKKKTMLERKVECFNQQMEQIEAKIQKERVRLEKLERRKYFDNIYFDSKEKEVQKRTEDEEFERMMEEELRKRQFEKKTTKDEPLSN
ncbi:tetratricopeptide repeat protein [candidate division KSB1 bacterium]|nr:tetratricopeptide repeat protein [candidate division KSB1 bacterium]